MTKCLSALGVLGGLLGTLLICTPAVAGPHKFAVIIGNNQGAPGSPPLNYAQQDALKMYNVLTQLGDFSPKDTALLLGKNAQDAWTALKQMEQRAIARSKQQNQKTLLLVYYSGHAEGDVLEMGRSTLKFSKLRQFLDQSNVDVRLAFIDSCHSGKLISTKGGKPGPGFKIHVTDQITSTGYAIITSSAHNELSQESKELRGGYFTHHLVSALRGSGDHSKDGAVTLSEAYKYAYNHTLSQTTATIGGSQHPMYHFQLEGRGEIVLTHLKKNHSHIEVSVEEAGRLMLLDEIGESILAEAQVGHHQSAFLSVPPGTYKIYIVKGSGVVRIAEANVRPYTKTHITSEHFRTAQLSSSVSKGGLFSIPETTWSHHLSAGVVWRTWPLDGGTNAFGASVHYRLVHTSGLQPTLRFTWTTAPDTGISEDYNDVGMNGGMGYSWTIHNLRLRTELIGGYEHLFQAPRQGEKRHSSGFNYLASMGFEMPFGNIFLCLDGGAGGRLFQVVDKGWVHRFDFQAIFSVGWQWGQQ